MMKKIIMTCCFGLLMQLLYAQEAQITGKVTDQNGHPLDAVSVVIVETNRGAVTNADGSFRIVAAIGQTLRFTMIGAEAKIFKIENVQPISIQLDINLALEEVVVTGYQTQRKADLTGAVSVVNVDEMNKQALANPMKALQGQVPGMYITGNGAPSAPATVRIRGIGTLNNNDPLYIIDGVPTKAGMHELNAADIESMQVLKDASAASIYGSRAANGVIIITTKRGKLGSAQVNVNAYSSASSYVTRAEMLDTEGYGRALWQASVNNNIDPNGSGLPYQFDWGVDPTTNQPILHSITVPEFLDANQTLRPSNTDWFDEVSRVGIIQNYDAQISNGTERGSYLLSLGYFDNRGIINTTGFNRISARINTDYRLFNNRLTIGQNLSLNKTEEVSANIINAALQALPIIPVRTVDGMGWGGPVQGMNDRHNPVRVLEDNKQNGYDYMRLFGNFFADLKILDNLVLRSNFGIDYGNYYARNWLKKYQSGYLVNTVNRLTNNQTHGVKSTWTNTLNYNLERNAHRFDMVGGMEFYAENNESFTATREGFVLEDPDYMYLNAGTGVMTTNGNASRHALLSYFAKANYSYLDKYLLSATIRYDGSSRFGENNRFGLFPAFSAGWRISEENFVKNNTSVFDDLKLRFGWGVTGNQEINNHAIFNIYLPNYNATSYDIHGNKSGVLPSGFYLTQNANPNLRWEATEMSNLGLDFSFAGQTIYGSADYYVKRTSDILLNPPYIAVLGEGGNMWVNGASMENRGFELMLGHRSRINDDLRLDIAANFDLVRNKVTHLPPEVVNAYGGDGREQNILGRTFGSHFGYIADGLFRTQTEVDAHASQPSKAVGRIRYRDINEDGVINDFDRTWIGVPLPKFTYGFNALINYKKFDLSFFLQGVGPVDVNNQFKLHTDFWSAVESSSNKGRRLLNTWSPSNPNSDIPAITLTDDNWEARFSTYFVENGMYLKLRNAQLGYTFDQALLAKIRLQALRLYVGGDNLGILLRAKSFTGVDPESPAFGYPNPMVITGGINLRF